MSREQFLVHLYITQKRGLLRSDTDSVTGFKGCLPGTKCRAHSMLADNQEIYASEEKAFELFNPGAG